MVVTMDDLTQGSSNKRQIPEAIFIDNVESLVGTQEAQHVVAVLKELHAKYQYMSQGLVSQKSSLKVKHPDIKEGLEMVMQLKKKREEVKSMVVDYQLAESVYTKAEISLENEKVCLWLGANVLLEYTYDEAIELLSTNLANASITLEALDEDIQFVRNQITTTEVNIARTHNFGVKQREKKRSNDAT
eukprot:GEMP01051788.1.p1 GENE.GEMP01051788.1~~GEMP01051788.1.p1  ORF type:complete len:188 (-),score=53.06 GEMP01051788.1:952-1515(-)